MSTTTITADELASMRADLAALLPDVAVQTRRNPALATTAAWPVVNAALPCRLTVATRASDPERQSDLAARVGANAVVRVPASADVRRLDALVIDGRRASVVYVVPAPRAHRTLLVDLEGVPQT